MFDSIRSAAHVAGLASFAVSLSAVATAQTVWTVDAGGGGDFTGLQAAIDAAAPGDVLRVLPGAYGPAVLSKALTVCGDGAQPMVAALDVQGAPTFALTNLAIARLRIANVPARAIVDGCTLGPGAPWNAPYFGWSAVQVDAAGDLLVQRSTVVAGYDAPGGSGYTALVARASDLVVVETTITGGSAPASSSAPGRGGDAVHLWGGTRAWFAACDVIGGAGDDGAPTSGAPLPGTGGVGLRIGESGAWAWADVRGGGSHAIAGGWQDASASGPQDGAAVRVMHACDAGPAPLLGPVTTLGAVDACALSVGARPWLAVGGVHEPGGTALVHVHGATGVPHVVALALAPAELTLPVIVGAPLWIDPAGLVLASSVVPTASPATLALPIPGDVALIGLRVHGQAFELAPVALVGSNVAAVVVAP